MLAILALASLGYAYSFGQNKVNYVQRDWAYLETMHFDIYFPADQEDFGRLAALMAEERYYYIKNVLKYPVVSRIPVIFYPSKNEFQTTNIIYPILSEGVGGFTESLKNRVVIPFEGSYTQLEELLTHELTHAYLNALDNRLVNTFRSLRPTSFPFWFSEGLPEYLSIGGEDSYNNMFILDMVVNDKLPSLDYISGYLAYRLGESILTYIGKTWGSDKVSEFFYAVRAMGSLEDATKKVFGMEFTELESRWRYQLKRDYFPVINTHSIPEEAYDKRSFSDKDGSYFNLAPRFSPDGSRYVYFSDQGARYSIWVAGSWGLSPAKKVITGESTPAMEEFYYFRSNLSWFPDNRRIAFASKTALGDRINILDVDTGTILQKIEIPQLSAIHEVDVSPDGTKIAMAAQSGMQADLFIYDIASGFVTRLTDDSYMEMQPRFSPDGRMLAYSAERQTIGEADGYFAAMTTDIYTIEIDSRSQLQRTFDDAKCSKPFWDKSGKRIIYLSDQGGVSNLQVLDLESGRRAAVAPTLCGIYSADISSDEENMVLSVYFKGAWNIYLGDNPLPELQYQDYLAAQPVTDRPDLLESVNLGLLDNYGKRPRVLIPREHRARNADIRRPFFGELYYPEEMYKPAEINYEWDQKPDSIGTRIPTIKAYKPKFHLDSLWGGLAYSSAVGAVGNLELGLSDLMGNHGIGINLGIAGKLENSNILLTYLYLKHRADYGVGLYNLFDEAYYRRLTNNPEHDYFRTRQRETGIYLLYRYPFNRFWRLDFENRLYQWEYHQDSWQWNSSYTEGEWINDTYPLNNPWEPISDLVYSPGISIVHDNALYGSTGPLVGWRGTYSIRKSFAKDGMDFLTNYFDLRNYSLFSRRYAWANRLIGGISTGGNPQRFDLGGYYGVRAYDGDLSGEKKLMYSTELRFPFFDYIDMAFPLPLGLSNIRGAAFMDLGAVWDRNSDFRGMRDGKLDDLHMGYGFGPRLNMGYFVLKFDVAWLTDLSRVSKPYYYLSLTEDF